MTSCPSGPWSRASRSSSCPTRSTPTTCASPPRRASTRATSSTPTSRTASTCSTPKGPRRPRMMSVGLHCRLVGRPGRFAALERFLDLRAAARGGLVLPPRRHRPPLARAPSLPAASAHEIRPGPDGPPGRARPLLGRATGAHPPLSHAHPQGGRPPGPALDGRGRHDAPRSTPSATWSAATRRRSRTAPPSSWARTSTRCATPAATTAISACSPRSRPWPHCTRRASACPSRSRCWPSATRRACASQSRSPARAPSPARSTALRWTPPTQDGIALREALAHLRLRPGRDPCPAPPRASRCWAMSSCTSSRVRCWRPRACRSASSPRSTVPAASRSRSLGDGRPCRHGADAPAPGRARGRGRDGPRRSSAQARAARDIVATVGRLEVRPGAVNVIPAAVTFTIDIRSPRDAARHDDRGPPARRPRRRRRGGAGSRSGSSAPTTSRRPPAHPG